MLQLSINSNSIILLTKTTATQNLVALSYYRVRGIGILAVAFVATIFIFGEHVLACCWSVVFIGILSSHLVIICQFIFHFLRSKFN